MQGGRQIRVSHIEPNSILISELGKKICLWIQVFQEYLTYFDSDGGEKNLDSHRTVAKIYTTVCSKKST